MAYVGPALNRADWRYPVAPSPVRNAEWPVLTSSSEDLAAKTELLQRELVVKRNKELLYRVKIPLGAFLGLMTYIGFNITDRSSHIVNEFLNLLTHRERAMKYIDNFDQSGHLLKPGTRAYLSALRIKLNTGAPKLEVEKVLSRLYAGNVNHGGVKAIQRHVSQYLKSWSRITADREGLNQIASLPIISRLVGRSPEAAKDLARHNRQKFLSALFSKVLYGFDPAKFQKVFRSLREANQIRAGLIAAMVAVNIAGFFVIANELETKRLMKGA